jgi:surfactin synthase thioesterase subunit
MGSSIALMLAYWLRRSGAPAPRGLLMAAGTPPNVWTPRGTHTLPDEGVIDELRRYGAAPAQVLANQELMELMLPMVRADFEMLDTLAPPSEPPLSVPLAAWGGTEDPQPTPHELEAWREYSTQEFSLQLITGGHFFIHSAGNALLEGVERTLIRWFPDMT